MAMERTAPSWTSARRKGRVHRPLFFVFCSTLVLSWAVVQASTVTATPAQRTNIHHQQEQQKHQQQQQEEEPQKYRHQHQNQKQILLDETFTSSLTPTESRDYMLSRKNWLQIVPNCEQGNIQEDPETESDKKQSGEEKRNDDDDGLHRVRGSWTITTNNGDDILITDTKFSDRRVCDRFDNVDDIVDGVQSRWHAQDGCLLSYNVFVNMYKDGVSFTFDIEYDIRPGFVRRQAHSFRPIGWKAKMVTPLIKSGLVELMQEENRRLSAIMNAPHNPSNAKIVYSSTNR